jgi:hypothetical protein
VTDLRARHVPSAWSPGHCALDGQPLPCDALRLLARVETLEGVRDAAKALLTAADNAVMDAFLDDEDGAEEPEWRGRLDEATDEFRRALARGPTGRRYGAPLHPRPL